MHSSFTFKSCDNELIINQGVVIERSVKLQCTYMYICKGSRKWWYTGTQKVVYDTHIFVPKINLTYKSEVYIQEIWESKTISIKYTNLTLPLFIEVPVSSQEICVLEIYRFCLCFYDYSIRFNWKCPNSMVFFFFILFLAQTRLRVYQY